jgi:hypothetical protein
MVGASMAPPIVTALGAPLTPSRKDAKVRIGQQELREENGESWRDPSSSASNELEAVRNEDLEIAFVQCG